MVPNHASRCSPCGDRARRTSGDGVLPRQSRTKLRPHKKLPNPGFSTELRRCPPNHCQGWIAHLGPHHRVRNRRTASVTRLRHRESLLRIEASGAILRGKFRNEPHAPLPVDFGKGTSSTRAVTAANSTAAFSRWGNAAPENDSLRNLLTAGECTPDTSSPGGTTHASQTASPPETEWCERRLLARIHRLTVATLRKQIAPVTAFPVHAVAPALAAHAPGTQVRGEHGTLEVIRQLQGFEIPASSWERFVLARRISDYDPAHLDQLCLTGAVGWVASRRIRPRSKLQPPARMAA